MADIFLRFRTDHKKHSKTNAYLCALLSYYAYEKNEDNTDRLGGTGTFIDKFGQYFAGISVGDNEDVLQKNIFSDGSTEAIVVHNSSGIWIVFRGTDDDAGEWIQPELTSGGITPGRHANMSAALRKPPSSWGPGRLHSGFYAALAAVYQPLRSHVRALLSDNKRPVFITGHSRGGALATLCAYRFQAVGNVPVSGVYTFGAPRVGNTAGFVSNYALKGANHGMNLEKSTFRWINGADPAPSVPMVSETAMKVALGTFMVANAALLGPILLTATGAAVSTANAAAAAAAFALHYKHSVPNSETYGHVGHPRHILTNGQVLSSGLDRDHSAHSLESLFDANLTLNKFSNWINDHDMGNYLSAMHSQLSSRSRRSSTSPSYLVRDDVPDPLAVFAPTLNSRLRGTPS